MQKNPMIEAARLELRRVIAIDLEDRSLSYRAIADKHGCSERTVAAAAKQLGLGRRPERAQREPVLSAISSVRTYLEESETSACNASFEDYVGWLKERAGTVVPESPAGGLDAAQRSGGRC